MIPTHNRAAVVGRAIESVLAQSRDPDEIIVVDDGSSDETAGIASRYGDRVRFVEKRHGGVSSARNLGVRCSRSRFVAFLDSDDVWDEGHLLDMERALEATGGRAALYFSDIRLPQAAGGGSIWGQIGLSIDGDYDLRPDGREWLFEPRQPMLIPASIVRRDMYLAVAGCDERLSCREDTHLFFKLGFAGAVCAVAGIAGEVTEDQERSLSKSFTSDDGTYLGCTVWLYDNLLTAAGDLTLGERKVLAQRSAAAHWKLARTSCPRRPGHTLWHLGNALRHDPAIPFSRLSSWRPKPPGSDARPPRVSPARSSDPASQVVSLAGNDPT